MLVQAEKWLKDQAQALGWSKVSKLKGRATLQGLVGISAKGDCGVMLEVNCETDFVARNNKFKSFVDLATQACFKHGVTMEKHQDLSKVILFLLRYCFTDTIIKSYKKIWYSCTLKFLDLPCDISCEDR
jgi:elongation factor Ts